MDMVYDISNPDTLPYTEVRRVEVEHTENDDIIYNKFMDKVKDRRKISSKEFDNIFDNEIRQLIPDARYDVFVRVCWEHGWDCHGGRIDHKDDYWAKTRL